MASAAAVTRNKLLKLNGHSDTVSSHEYTRTTDSPDSSPQLTSWCPNDTESPSSSEDDPGDTNTDESESQGLAGCTRASSSMVHDFEADPKTPCMHKSSRRTSFGTDLDLSVIIALIAPLVNWLTGSDHLESLFLVLFLIVYLHQLVQVPWELYNASRRRRPHPTFRSLNLQENEEAVIKVQTSRAATELRRSEFAYLFLSMVTPFAGAALLRSVLRSINGGVDSISWFSTTLFVLAAGVRPWGHLISRLREHTSSLHDSIHYPSPDSQFIVDSRLQVVVDRVNSLEQELSTVTRAMVMRAYVDDMHEELNSALQDTERTIRKQERRAESTRNSYDTRLAILEKAVSRIERTRGERVRGMALSGISTNGHRYKSLEFVIYPIFHFIRALANGLTFDYFDPPSTQTSPKTPLAFMGPRPSLHHAKPPNWPWLETIEEDAMEQLSTNQLSSFGQSDEAPLISCQSDPDDVGISRTHRLGQGPRKMTNVIANVVSLPYRLSVGIIVAVSPPLQHFFH